MTCMYAEIIKKKKFTNFGNGLALYERGARSEEHALGKNDPPYVNTLQRNFDGSQPTEHSALSTCFTYKKCVTHITTRARPCCWAAVLGCFETSARRGLRTQITHRNG